MVLQMFMALVEFPSPLVGEGVGEGVEDMPVNSLSPQCSGFHPHPASCADNSCAVGHLLVLRTSVIRFTVSPNVLRNTHYSSCQHPHISAVCNTASHVHRSGRRLTGSPPCIQRSLHFALAPLLIAPAPLPRQWGGNCLFLLSLATVSFITCLTLSSGLHSDVRCTLDDVR